MRNSGRENSLHEENAEVSYGEKIRTDRRNGGTSGGVTVLKQRAPNYIAYRSIRVQLLKLKVLLPSICVVKFLPEKTFKITFIPCVCEYTCINVCIPPCERGCQRTNFPQLVLSTMFVLD